MPDGIPICAVCGTVIWPDDPPPKVFIHYLGNPDDRSLDKNLVRAAITHAGPCSDAFERRRDSADSDT